MSRIAAPLDRRHNRAVMVTRKRIALALFLLWEAYWAYVFFTAPAPDEKMDTVFALLMGVFLPLAVVAAAALLIFAARIGRRKPRIGLMSAFDPKQTLAESCFRPSQTPL